MSHAKLEITKTKTSGTSMERSGNTSHDDIQKLMDKYNFLNFPQAVIPYILGATR